LAVALLLLSVVAATVPMLGFLWLVWWLDRYDREPVGLYLLTFVWGAVGSITVAMLGSCIVELPILILAPGLADTAGAVLVAPLVEEPSKACFLLLLMFSRHFDNMTDGFVYGAAIGLGFGMTENFMYFADVGATGDAVGWVMTVVIRTLYSAVMHATATSIVGASLGWAKFRGPAAIVLFGTAGICIAIAVHAFWNGMLTLDAAANANGALLGINLLIFPFEVGFTALVFQVCLLQESAVIRRELREEAEQGRIPPEHPAIIASWWRRGQSWWVPRGLEHDSYVQTMTTLAMRKEQFRLTGDDFYKDDVAVLREQVDKMWDKARAAA